MLLNLNPQLGTKALLLGLVIGLNTLTLPAQAQKVRLPDHPSYWQQQSEVLGKVPRLINSGSTSQVPTTSATYYFTIVVPHDARDALKAVTINQKSGLEKIAFQMDRSEAVIGDTLASGSPIMLAAIGGSEAPDTNNVMVVFDQPIQPGNTVTIGVKARENPQRSGVYTFGVTAFPDNDNSPSLYLGTTRLDFTGSN